MKVKHQIKSLVVLNAIAAVLTLWLSYAFISGRLVGIGWGWTLGQAITGLVSLFFIAHNYLGVKPKQASQRRHLLRQPPPFQQRNQAQSNRGPTN